MKKSRGKYDEKFLLRHILLKREYSMEKMKAMRRKMLNTHQQLIAYNCDVHFVYDDYFINIVC